MSININITTNNQQWISARKAWLAANIDRKIQVFLAREAELMRGHIIQGFTNSGISAPWKPLSPWTLAMRRFRKFGGTKPLIHSGEMRKSVITESSGYQAFCGILYSTRAKNGQPMVNLAKVHEFGATIVLKITPKMRKFLAMIAKFAGFAKKKSSGGGSSRSSGVLIIRIPPRPFMFPARQKLEQGQIARVEKFFPSLTVQGTVI